MIHCLRKMFLCAVFAAFVSTVFASAIFAQDVDRHPAGATDEWLADVDALDRLIRQHHPDPFFRTGEGTWQDALNEARQLVRSGASDAVITMELMSAVAHLGDGHTRLEPVGVDAFANWIPLRFYVFDDGNYVTVAAEPYADLVGRKLIGIAGRSTTDVLAMVARATAADNTFQRIEGAAALLSNAGLLAALGIIKDPTKPVALIFEDSDGNQVTRAIPTVHSWYSVNYRNWGELFGPPVEPFDIYRTPFHGGKKPMAYRDLPNDADAPFYASRKPYWVRLDREDTVLTFQFNVFADIGEIGWDDFRNAMWEMLDTAQPDRFVIDLRFNFGGDGRMVRVFINELLARPEYANNNRLVVLTGRQTFSAAIMLVAELKNHTDAIFVGEPAGAPLNSYGDPISLSLPSGRLELVVSTLYWQLGHPSNRNTIIPVHSCVLTKANDYFAGTDLAWNTAVSIKTTGPGLSASTCKLAEREGFEPSKGF